MGYKTGDLIKFKVIKVSDPYFNLMTVQSETGSIYVMDASGRGAMAWQPDETQSDKGEGKA